MTVRANNEFLPYGYHDVGEDDIAAVTNALRGKYLTGGDFVVAFEDALKTLTGARHAIAVSNGTTGLHLCADALGLGPGDAAVVPSLTFLATANAVRYTGAEVIFADVDPDTGLMTAETLREALGRVPRGLSVKAVFPVHLGGQVAAPQEIGAEARARSLYVVEDACHALGTTYGGGSGTDHAVGATTHADLTVFSFHPVKSIAMGEGGAVLTNAPDLDKRIRVLRSHGMEPTGGSGGADDAVLGLGERYPSHYKMDRLGYNYRVSDVNCALGLSQIGKLQHFLSRRRHLVCLYDEAFAELPAYMRPAGRVLNCRPGWHLYVALIDFAACGKPRSQVMKKLAEMGIGSQVHYYPVHAQPYYRQRYGALPLRGTAAYYNKCLSLPLFPAMQDTDVRRVVDGLVTALS